MNILFIAYGLYPCNTGGTEIFNYYLMRELAKDHKIHILTCCREEIDVNAVIHRIDRKKLGAARLSVPLLSLFKYVRLRKKIDMIHLPYMSPDWPAWIPVLIVKKLFGIPYIISIRGGGMRKWKPQFPYKYLFNNAAAIIGVSDRLKEEYEKRTGREVIFVPSGLPFTRSRESRSQMRTKYGFSSSDIIIISVSSIKKLKGSDILLNAFLKLGEQYVRTHNLKLLFVGEGDMRNELETRTEEMNFSDHVKFIGNIPYRGISSLLNMADIYITSSLFEGMSNSMLEAMFNGMPIIGNDASGISNMIKHGENGLLYKFNDSDDLRDNIVYLVEHKDIAKKIGLGAKTTYDSNYDYETVVKRYVEIYESVGRQKK